MEPIAKDPEVCQNNKSINTAVLLFYLQYMYIAQQRIVSCSNSVNVLLKAAGPSGRLSEGC